jgi:hypothetical protein
LVRAWRRGEPCFGSIIWLRPFIGLIGLAVAIGGFALLYNAQAAVEAEVLLIVGQSVTEAPKTSSNWSRWWKPSSNNPGTARTRFWRTTGIVRKRT